MVLWSETYVITEIHVIHIVLTATEIVQFIEYLCTI